MPEWYRLVSASSRQEIGGYFASAECFLPQNRNPNVRVEETVGMVSFIFLLREFAEVETKGKKKKKNDSWLV